MAGTRPRGHFGFCAGSEISWTTFCGAGLSPEGVGSVEPVQPPPGETETAPTSEETPDTPPSDETADVPPPDETEEEPTVPSTEEQIEQCTEQTGEPEACRKKIAP